MGMGKLRAAKRLPSALRRVSRKIVGVLCFSHTSPWYNQDCQINFAKKKGLLEQQRSRTRAFEPVHAVKSVNVD